MKIHTESYSLSGKCCSQIQDRGDWLDGDVMTPRGAVAVMTQGDEKSEPMTRLDLAHNGKHYIRTIGRRFTARGLAMAARKFADDIVR